MKFITNGGIPFWQFNRLGQYKWLQHFVTNRQGGLSTGKYTSLNLSYNVEDKSEKVDKNRELLCKNLAIDVARLIFPDQCHGNHITEIKADTSVYDIKNTDALITKEKNICIGILTADCAPLLVYDPVKHVVAAIHAGWRGTVAGITALTIQKLRDSFDSNSADLQVCIAPFISHGNYEVGIEVADEVRKYFKNTNGILFNSDKDDKWYFDLGEANRRQLVQSGVNNEKIQITGICTYEHSEKFFSARRDGLNTGRFATGIMLL